MFSVIGITSTVKASLEESLVQILSPRRRIDILRDAMDAKKRGKPYSITFCGVNGVGKSTNLAKVHVTLILSLDAVLVTLKRHRWLSWLSTGLSRGRL